MPKVIKNPIEYKVVKVEGGFEVSAHYGLSCTEYPELESRKGISITLLPNTLTDIDDEGMGQINAAESIS